LGFLILYFFILPLSGLLWVNYSENLFHQFFVSYTSWFNVTKSFLFIFLPSIHPSFVRIIKGKLLGELLHQLLISYPFRLHIPKAILLILLPSIHPSCVRIIKGKLLGELLHQLLISYPFRFHITQSLFLILLILRKRSLKPIHLRISFEC
jgi:hypothetical protein